MRSVVLGCVLATSIVALASVTAGSRQEATAASAERIHRQAIVLDTHIDTTQALMLPGWDFKARHQPPSGSNGRAQGYTHVDLPRMREGGLDGAFFSIYMPGTVTGPEAVKRSLELIDAVRSLVERHPAEFALCLTAGDVRAAHQAGKVAVLLGMEGGHMIDSSLAVLRTYARLGVRYLTLTHSVNTPWADSSGDEAEHDGLTDFGKEVVRELNRLGMLVDVSHVADATFWDALETSQAPIIASHSSARAISGHPRNLSDDMIKALAAKGGVVQINYLTSYLDDTLYRAQQARRPLVARLRAELETRLPGPGNEEKRAAALRAELAKLPPLPSVSWEKIVEHIDHVVRLVGPRHVGLGSDFDGAPMPQGMEDCTHLPRITEALVRRGYTQENVELILGGNVLRLLDEAQQVSRRLADTSSH